MNTSIRFRLVGWLEGIRDHVAKVLVQLLRGAEVHSNAGRDLRNGFVVGVDDQAAKGEGDNTDVLPRLHDQVNEMDWSPIVPDFNKLISEGQLSSAANHNIIRHQNHPPIRNYLDTARMNVRFVGVHTPGETAT